MDGPFSEEDELFLFETFTKITNKESQTDCFFIEDDNDIPLSEFFLFEKGEWTDFGCSPSRVAQAAAIYSFHCAATRIVSL